MSETTIYVGAVVRHDGGILFVRQSPGHPLQGQWTLPWGRVDPGESPAAAALRETLEEGGVTAEVEGFLGIQELPAPNAGGIGLAYLCRHLRGTPQPLDGETDAARYFTATELTDLTEPIEPWSEWLANRVFIGDYSVSHEDPTNPLQRRGSYL